ncbi:hypothetical protein FZC35_01805 [Candidatus Cytomitobacter indipagum]|uniref:Uncharacterized protein n=1 Tax=Candidatus Cytomitobacter indipagum TaxID=2601575 RepID=A0A5C0UGE6_9PROT|nr:hypothetical protein [Candidatus Cytomitobacter indipagum]QEK38104.1 hypothetical protein FZC35_01805 [Candidatus Cytomitobacter indipagum]
MSKYLALFLLGAKIYGMNSEHSVQDGTDESGFYYQNASSTAIGIEEACKEEKEFTPGPKSETEASMLGSIICDEEHQAISSRRGSVAHSAITLISAIENPDQVTQEQRSNAASTIQIEFDLEEKAQIDEQNRQLAESFRDVSDAVEGAQDELNKTANSVRSILKPQASLRMSVGSPQTLAREESNPSKSHSHISQASTAMTEVECNERGCTNKIRIKPSIKVNPNLRVVCENGKCSLKSPISVVSAKQIMPKADLKVSGSFGCCGGTKKNPNKRK